MAFELFHHNLHTKFSCPDCQKICVEHKVRGFKMPFASVRDRTRIRYEVSIAKDKREHDINSKQKYLVITLGGRSGVKESKKLAENLSMKLENVQIITWDRRNTGQSGIGFPNSPLVLEDVEDLHDILVHLQIKENVILYGSSSGARVSAMFAVRYSQLLTGLILAPPTGSNSIEELIEMYYNGPLKLLKDQGLVALANSSFFKDLSDESKQSLIRYDQRKVEEALMTTSEWMRRFSKDILIGLDDNELKSLASMKHLTILVLHDGNVRDQLHDSRVCFQVTSVLGLDRIYVHSKLFKHSDPSLSDFLARILQTTFPSVIEPNRTLTSKL